MRLVKLALLILASTSLYAQQGKFSATLSYPMPLGNNMFDRNTGVLDAGVQYRFVNAGMVNLGGSLNVGYYSYTISSLEFKEKDFLIQPRVFAELQVATFRPFAGVGYTFTRFHQEFDNGGSVVDNNWNGVNLNVGASLDILPRVFLLAQFDYVKLSGGAGLPKDFPEVTNIYVFKIGAGIRI